ncbi:hypothetical protein [Streptomyces sp. G-G2]|uniref:glycine-rich domain-containing protein n=1 Tax=Streptomyces sp. G-G2 TaxID=3046201 RepID=UPI0024BA16EC|nr:hypothetical protein [Streptomyces sp. G-G2]MDJ0385864.1 hypothetical protein [Streptomyces sp. G-G2]
MTTTTETTTARDTRSLLAETEFDGVTATVLDNNPGMTPELADRITLEALAFVATCAVNPGAGLAPSPVVDEGWHALILHTDLYARLCARLGVFVHHYPERPGATGGFRPDVIEYTLDTMRAAGFTPDLALWVGPTESPFTVAAPTWHSPTCGIKPMPSPQCLSDPKETPIKPA